MGGTDFLLGWTNEMAATIGLDVGYDSQSTTEWSLRQYAVGVGLRVPFTLDLSGRFEGLLNESRTRLGAVVTGRRRFGGIPFHRRSDDATWQTHRES